MLKRFILITVFCIIALCSFSQNVEIKLLNKTGYDIDNLSYEGKELGTLKKNGLLTFKTDSLQLVLNTPVGYPAGSIKGIKIESFSGTGLSSDVTIVKEGNYIFDIVLTEHKFPFKGYTLDFKSREK